MFEFSFSFKYQISFLLRVFSVIFHWNWLPEIRDIETFPTKIQHLLHFKNTQPPINFHVHSEYREAMEIQFPLNVSALLHHHKHWSPASVIFVELSECVCVLSFEENILISTNKSTKRINVLNSFTFLCRFMYTYSIRAPLQQQKHFLNHLMGCTFACDFST